jgi:membrane-bound metal-dependent hydrolase YbcI (DUF457 family)
LDNLTHSLFGLTLGRTPLGQAGRGTTTALLLASNSPDIDIVATAGGALRYLEWHRGPTHGPLGVIGLGLATAAIVWAGRRAWNSKAATEPPASFLMLWAIATVGVVCHVLMDLPTSYGTRLFSPFDWRWFAEDWMPIIDVYLLIALAAGLLFGGASLRTRRRAAVIVLVFTAANYVTRAVTHHQAMVQASRLFGPLLPEPCDDAIPLEWIDRWPRDRHAAGAELDGERDRSATRCVVEIAAIPDFLSPFHWRVVAHLSNAYEMHDLDLLVPRAGADTEWRLSVRYPNQWTPAVMQASRSRVAQVFLGFSRFPSVRSVVDGSGDATVTWNDMRFVPGRADDRRVQRPNLFTATVSLDRDGRILEEKLGP